VLTDILCIILNYDCYGGALLSWTSVSHVSDYGELQHKPARSPVKSNRRFGGICLPSSGSKSRPACYLFHSGFLLGLLFVSENGGDIFLRNVG
jgi:hypothetical protein